MKTVTVGDDDYLVVLLTKNQVTRIAEAVVDHLLKSGIDVVLADRIRSRMRALDQIEEQRELEAEHRRYAPGFDH